MLSKLISKCGKSPENQGFLITMYKSRKTSFSCKVPALRFPTFDFGIKHLILCRPLHNKFFASSATGSAQNLFPLDFRFFNHRDFHCFFVILLSTFCIFHHGDFICGSFCTHFVLRVNRVELHYFLDIQRFHLVFEEDNL